MNDATKKLTTEEVKKRLTENKILLKFDSYDKYEFRFRGEDSQYIYFAYFGGNHTDIYRYYVDVYEKKRLQVHFEDDWKALEIRDQETNEIVFSWKDW